MKRRRRSSSSRCRSPQLRSIQTRFLLCLLSSYCCSSFSSPPLIEPLRRFARRASAALLLLLLLSGWTKPRCGLEQGGWWGGGGGTQNTQRSTRVFLYLLSSLTTCVPVFTCRPCLTASCGLLHFAQQDSDRRGDGVCIEVQTLGGAAANDGSSHTFDTHHPPSPADSSHHFAH